MKEKGCLPCKAKALFSKKKKKTKETKKSASGAKSTKECSWWMIWC